jgi:hypothetical protein
LKSTNNSILLETGRSYHSTLFLIFVAPVFLQAHILLYFLTTQIQQCRCTDPGPSSSQRSHCKSGRFNPVCSFRIVCCILTYRKHFLYIHNF